ncbi:Transglutaminase-like superfamily protein [Ruminococcaceae bacterium KH2T8]|nr:Transglutaminase-like superfamily protein [Ruminococcaceae bacterium KH2T8]
MARRKRGKMRTITKVLIFADIVMALVLAGDLFYHYDRKMAARIVRNVTIETGSAISLDDFFNEPIDGSYFVTDVSLIDTSHPGTYGITLHAGRFDTESVLNVVDTTAPTGTAVPQTIYAGRLPDVYECVTDIYDLSDVSVSYYEENPDVSVGGDHLVPVQLMDNSGNVGVIHVPFTIIDDHTAPVIEGAEDKEYFIGDSIMYREGVTVTDDYDPDPVLTIDTSAVDPDTDGVYPVIYTAEDEVGNISTVTVEITMRTMPEGYVDPEIVYGLAQEVLDEITEPDMTDVEKAFRIFNWARWNIHYVGYSTKTDWTAGAYEGFTTLQGDCFTYYACCKALLDVAGIENCCVERYPATNSMHFWNLVNLDGWYHCDASPSFEHSGFWFMRTDDELDYSHQFDDTDLPERETESVQDRLDFTNFTIEEE